MLTKKPPGHAVSRAKKSVIYGLLRRLLTTSLFLVTSLSAMADTHSQLTTTPCDIRLVFGSDALGMPSVGYKLSLQIRNRTARDLPGCLSIGWTTNLPSLATAQLFVGQKARRSAHLKPGHARPSFSRLAGPCCKGLDKLRGRTSLIINWPILTLSQIVPSLDIITAILSQRPINNFNIWLGIKNA